MCIRDSHNILFTYESLDVTAEWLLLCRQTPACASLGLPAQIRDVCASIELQNGGRASYGEADGYSLHVGGIMDVRSIWQLRKD